MTGMGTDAGPACEAGQRERDELRRALRFGREREAALLEQVERLTRENATLRARLASLGHYWVGAT